MLEALEPYGTKQLEQHFRQLCWAVMAAVGTTKADKTAFSPSDFALGWTPPSPGMTVDQVVQQMKLWVLYTGGTLH